MVFSRKFGRGNVEQESETKKGKENDVSNRLLTTNKKWAGDRKLKDPLLTMALCAPNEKQDKGNLGQKGLSDNTKVDLGPRRIMVSNGSLMKHIKHSFAICILLFITLGGIWQVKNMQSSLRFVDQFITQCKFYLLQRCHFFVTFCHLL